MQPDTALTHHTQPALPQPEEAQLAAAAVEAAGKRRQWEAFYRDHKDEVFRVVFAVATNRELADDVVQEAFCRAMKHWGRIGPEPAQRRGWVIRTALNEVKRWRRKVGQHELPEEASNTPERAGELEPLQELLPVLRTLPPRQREVAALRYLLDLTPAEVAQLLGIAVSTVAVHEHRARKRLRTVLEDGGEAR